MEEERAGNVAKVVQHIELSFRTAQPMLFLCYVCVSTLLNKNGNIKMGVLLT